VAAAIPDAPPIAAAVASLAPRLGGAFGQQGATPSGTAAAVAEAWIGAARGVQDLVYFACADHTTGGMVRGGAPVTGVRGRAASVAWLALNPVEREDYRKSGCLEAEVAAAGIVRRLVWRIKAGDRSRVTDAVNGDFAAITVPHVLDAARQHDGVSISVIRDTAKYLGMAAANLVVVADPEMLVLGGIMASAADLLMDPLRTEIARRLPKPVMDALRIETASLRDDAAAIGAARLAGAPAP
jgi:glucokinase